MDYIGLIIAGLALATAMVQHWRITKIPDKIKAEIKADAVLAGALLIADALVASAKIKSDARLAKEDLTGT